MTVGISPAEQIAMLTRIVMRQESRLQVLEARLCRKEPAQHLPKRSAMVRKTRETMTALVTQAADIHGVPQVAIMARDRTKAPSQARQWVMFEASIEGLSSAEIGRFLGRDHSSVLHGIRAEKERREDG